MAQDAELRLKVSLDLAFFRQQLAGLGQAAAGYNMPVQVKFDRRSVQNELNALGTNIRRRNYFLEIKTNLKDEIKNARELASEMAKLSLGAGGTISRKGGTFRQELSGLDTANIQKIYAAAAKAGLISFNEETNKEKGKIITALNQAANDAGQGFLNAFSKQTSAVRKAAGEYGDALLNGLRKTLRSQSPSREMFDIGEDAGKGFELGLLRSMELAEQSATRKMRRMLDRLARVALMASGMSAAEINRQAGQFQAAPAIGAPSWASTVPPSRGGSGGGRLLPPGPTFAALGGTAFGAQKYLPTDLSAELKRILKEAAFAFVDAIKSEIREVRIGLAETGRGALPPARIAGLLPAAIGRVPSTYSFARAGETRQELFQRRTQEAYARSAERETAAQFGQVALPPGRERGLGAPGFMTAPSIPGGPPRGPRRPYLAGGGFGGEGPSGGGIEATNIVNAARNALRYGEALNISRKSLEGFRASSIPFIGGLKEISGEFLNATKQVLLYGTAYKGLAFITSLPGQILNAAKSQQQFGNAMQTATQDTGTFAKEMLYVDNVQRAFGLNLETTRQGFVRLYASMAPTGFDSGSIEKLFTGISAATSALQLTPDKAERVIYAFGQMASKGQIMSEELKGQLGDVLPGALAIFAKAAGMSVKEFSQAMEDGQFVGQRFREVFAKVSDELMTRFGTGAQAAGRSLQGLLNTVQGDFQRTLESFAPLANAAAQALLGPLSGALKQLSMSAQLAMGEQQRVMQQLQDARTSGDSAQNIAALEAKLSSLNAAAKDPAIAKQTKDIEAFVVQVTEASRGVSNLVRAISGLLGPAFTALGTNLNSVIQSLIAIGAGFIAMRVSALAAMAVLTTFKTIEGMTRGAAIAANLLAAAYRMVGVQATAAQVATIGFGTAVKGLLASTGIGLLVVALGSIATAFLSVGDRAAEAAAKTKAAMDKMQDAIRTGNVEIAKADLYATNRQRQGVEDAARLLDQLEQSGRRTGGTRGTTMAKTTLAQRMQLEQAGFDLQGRTEIDVNLIRRQINPLRTELRNLQQRQTVGVSLAEQQRQRLGLGKPEPRVTTEVDTGKPDKGTRLREYNSEAIAIQRKGLDNLVTQIESTVELTRRQKDLQIASEKYRVGLVIADLQHKERIKDIGKLKEEYRGLAKVEADRMLGVEQNSLRQEYNKAVLGDLFDITENYTRQIAQAEDKAVGLSNATGELTERQKVDLLIMRQLQDVSEKDLPLFQSRIDLARDLADKLDILNQTEKDLLETRKLQQELDTRQKEVGVMGQGLSAGFYGSAAQVHERTLNQPGGTPEHARQMAELETRAMQLESVFGGIQTAIGGIGDAFGTMMTQGITQLIQGTATAQEVFSSFLKAVGDALLQAASQMIATYVAIGIARIFAGMGGGGGGQSLEAYTPQGNAAFMERTGRLGFANGGIASGGFRAFANGGIVQGPTLGLVGEGRYNEAIVPLPDGRAIPVQMQGDSVRDRMNNSSNSGAASPVLSMNFETTTINNVEYVSREQLERAMMETRSLATRDGARQGANLAIDKLQQSPNTRRRIGI